MNDIKRIAFAGNPNVGKSTVFNALTGLNQHTGNWAGKTVLTAVGYYKTKSGEYCLIDTPGSYSLLPHSKEEETAGDYICFCEPDAVVIVCDAVCLERSMNLVLQILETTDKAVVCVNLIDEAKRKGITIDCGRLSEKLGVSVVPTSARDGRGLDELMNCVEKMLYEENMKAYDVIYTRPIEEALSALSKALEKRNLGKLKPRWVALKLLDGDERLIKKVQDYIGFSLTDDEEINRELLNAQNKLFNEGIDRQDLKDRIASCVVMRAEELCCDIIETHDTKAMKRDRKIDKILTSKKTGFPIMLLLLTLVFYITVTGANYPSEFLSEKLFWLGERLRNFMNYICAPSWLTSMVTDGIYRVLAWVTAVMLPPMAIFFPLFTLLEDLGYLPRIAFNLDKYFKSCRACGKQALTMCMGFGCNAVGVTGCRIIDSPRERLIAMLTNNFVPCNGRFPTLISIIIMFFVGKSGGFSSVWSALLLTLFILLGVFMTFLVSSLLSKTLLKGVPSSFTLELPPYRKPQFFKVIVRSVFDRTLFVLGRAVMIAAPAGLVIWLMSNITVGDASALKICTDFIDPFARLIGLDGVILMGFILGFPANEIVIPIIIMAYTNTGKIMELGDLSALKTLFLANGWTWVTAINVMLFSLMHWPCSTTLLTVKKESKSLKWTLLAFLIPTISGMVICFLFTQLSKLFL